MAKLDAREYYAKPAIPTAKELGGLLTAEEAAEYLGVKVPRLGQLATEYGIGRRYRLEPRIGWYYAKIDIDKIKEALEAEAQAKPAEPAAAAAAAEG